MLRRLVNSWTVFFVMVFGILLLMLSMRPDLQPRPGHPDAPAPTIELIGHVLTWTTGSVLAIRAIRDSRISARSQGPKSGV